MEPQMINSGWDRNLVESLSVGDCVAFIGAGFASAVEMPLWRPLLSRLVKVVKPHSKRADLIEYAESCIAEGELPRAASVLRLADDGHRINQALKAEFDSVRLFVRRPANDQRKVEMRERLEALTSLPWAGYITTNYDTLVLDYLVSVGRPCNNRCSTPYGNLAQTLKSSDRPFFVHLHGNVADGNLVLGETDYDEAYLVTPSLTSFLRAIFMRYTVVFLGTQVEDRLAEIRRQLQLLFRDRHVNGGAPSMEPEYVMLAATDSQRGTYLESTGGFRAVYYENASSNHEGFVPALDDLRLKLAKHRGTTSGNDQVNERLLTIVRANPGGIKQRSIIEQFWTAGPPAGWEDLSSGELYFRMFYLIHRRLVTLDEQYDVFRPV